MNNNPAGELEAKFILNSFMTNDEIIEINKTKVFCSKNTAGGGQTFGQDFVPLLNEIYPGRIFDSCLEWCAGPGFIGISLYNSGICNKITFFEKHSEAIAQLERTKIENNFGDEFTIIHDEDVSRLIGTYDLIVANPPHFSDEIYFLRNGPKHLWLDKDWKVHINFFNNIKKNLSKNGVILLQECSMSNAYSSFDKLLKDTGLKIVRSFTPSFAEMKYIYYIEITHT
jgi:methylase of polypeptide subunit release factors